jgi:CspA family cold shock protein
MKSNEKKESLASQRVRGIVKWFDPARGYGFIALEGSRDLLVGARDVANGTDLQAGDHVEFELRRGSRGLRAASVQHAIEQGLAAARLETILRNGRHVVINREGGRPLSKSDDSE